MLPETPYVLYMQLQHQGNSLEMVLLSIFFTRIRSTEDHQQVFFIHFVAHALALHLAVKILAQIFHSREFEHVGLTYICRLYSLQNAAGPPLLRNQYY